MDGNHGAERYETVIIGGGQAGLATGYHLAKLGRSFVILEADRRIGDVWRKRWDSLHLFTPARHDGTGEGVARTAATAFCPAAEIGSAWLSSLISHVPGASCTGALAPMIPGSRARRRA